MKRFGDTASNRTLLGALLVGAGLLLLILQFFENAAGALWPAFVILPGAILLALATITERQWKQLATAGAIVAGTGLILLVQSVFDYYRSWAYAWTLLPFFAGAALVWLGSQHGDEAATSTGRSLLQWAAVAFVLFAAAFEILVFDGGMRQGRIILPLLLIGVGGVLLLRRRSEPSADNGKPPDFPKDMGSST